MPTDLEDLEISRRPLRFDVRVLRVSGRVDKLSIVGRNGPGCEIWELVSWGSSTFRAGLVQTRVEGL